MLWDTVVKFFGFWVKYLFTNCLLLQIDFILSMTTKLKILIVLNIFLVSTLTAQNKNVPK